MENLKTILKLQDNASAADVEAAVQAMQQENETLQQANDTLTEENRQLREAANTAEEQRMQAQKTEAVQLVDAAVRDGRLHANGKDAFLALFDADFEKAKATLDAIPKVKSVTSQMEQAQVELKDYTAKSWAELDRAGVLPMLRDKAPDLYAEKFREAFGHDPK